MAPAMSSGSPCSPCSPKEYSSAARRLACSREPGEAGHLRGPEQLRAHPGGQGAVVVAMPPPQRVLLAGGGEPVAAVLADRVQHPVTHVLLVLLPDQDGLVHQADHQVDDLFAGDART